MSEVALNEHREVHLSLWERSARPAFARYASYGALGVRRSALRVGRKRRVRDYGLSLEQHPSPDLLSKSTSPRRGEVNPVRNAATQPKLITL